MLIELQADNPDRALKPGAFAQVSLPVDGTANSLRVPVSALMFREEGPTVGVVGANGKVVVKPVSIGRDEGQKVEITSGINANDRVISTPPDALQTGDTVKLGAPDGKSGK
jgi:multidrug efflux pump subunit AcrA (membrane-fusion protein)